MSGIMKNYKYQLVHPIVGTKIYQSKSFNSAAKKCYCELKASRIDSSYFTILNIDTSKTYQFEIDRGARAEGSMDMIIASIKDLNVRVERLENAKQPEELVANVAKIGNSDQALAEAIEANSRRVKVTQKQIDENQLVPNEQLCHSAQLEENPGNDEYNFCTIM
ncbi:MAG: hypothetical protein Harvfovirus23_12 [Harvfovirus sp.]|uniref:Uncharacterized protein n=1 Tax=Harvfovirus sp. TaxID=2487768 RepID=A0A3G5A2A6_9VIRU|nr:MAG: hypothetical protein Harvfovirus23_12 [Harvfovirus sp.]